MQLSDLRANVQVQAPDADMFESLNLVSMVKHIIV